MFGIFTALEWTFCNRDIMGGHLLAYCICFFLLWVNTREQLKLGQGVFWLTVQEDMIGKALKLAGHTVSIIRKKRANRPVNKPPRPTSSDPLPPVRIHTLKVGPPSQTGPPAGDQVFTQEPVGDILHSHPTHTCSLSYSHFLVTKNWSLWLNQIPAHPLTNHFLGVTK